jgi:eukaryotic-like serine/threonine-protein kinase
VLVPGLVDGPDLAKVLRENKTLPLHHVVAIAIQICHVLEEAHSLAEPIVHCDLKPANVLLDHWPNRVWAKVTDFGISKVMSEATSPGLGPGVGTPLYMAPEQWRGERIDGRTDLYALGGMLYHLLVGNPPFQGRGEALMYKHLNDSPPPLDERFDYGDVFLRELIGTLMMKDPDKRPATATDVRLALEWVARRCSSWLFFCSRCGDQVAPYTKTTSTGEPHVSNGVYSCVACGERLAAVSPEDTGSNCPGCFSVMPYYAQWCARCGVRLQGGQ